VGIYLHVLFEPKESPEFIHGEYINKTYLKYALEVDNSNKSTKNLQGFKFLVDKGFQVRYTSLHDINDKHNC